MEPTNEKNIEQSIEGVEPPKQKRKTRFWVVSFLLPFLYDYEKGDVKSNFNDKGLPNPNADGLVEMKKHFQDKNGGNVKYLGVDLPVIYVNMLNKISVLQGHYKNLKDEKETTVLNGATITKAELGRELGLKIKEVENAICNDLGINIWNQLEQKMAEENKEEPTGEALGKITEAAPPVVENKKTTNEVVPEIKETDLEENKNLSTESETRDLTNSKKSLKKILTFLVILGIAAVAIIIYQLFALGIMERFWKNVILEHYVISLFVIGFVTAVISYIVKLFHDRAPQEELSYGEMVRKAEGGTKKKKINIKSVHEICIAIGLFMMSVSIGFMIWFFIDWAIDHASTGLTYVVYAAFIVLILSVWFFKKALRFISVALFVVSACIFAVINQFNLKEQPAVQSVEVVRNMTAQQEQFWKDSIRNSLEAQSTTFQERIKDSTETYRKKNDSIQKDLHQKIVQLQENNTKAIERINDSTANVVEVYQSREDSIVKALVSEKSDHAQTKKNLADLNQQVQSNQIVDNSLLWLLGIVTIVLFLIFLIIRRLLPTKSSIVSKVVAVTNTTIAIIFFVVLYKGNFMSRPERKIQPPEIVYKDSTDWKKIVKNAADSVWKLAEAEIAQVKKDLEKANQKLVEIPVVAPVPPEEVPSKQKDIVKNTTSVKKEKTKKGSREGKFTYPPRVSAKSDGFTPPPYATVLAN